MRESGILMPVSSLPGPYGIGCFGKEAFKFVDFLAQAGQKIWQILPLSPTGYGDSPYQSCSAFAGNPYFIDLDALKEEGLLTAAQLKAEKWGTDPKEVDYGTLYVSRFKVLRTAYAAWRKQCAGLHGCSYYFPDDYYAFTLANEEWLDDYALYMALKVANGMKNWVEWDKPYRLRDKKALAAFAAENEEEIGFWKFLQYEFAIQWKKLKAYANKQGIEIIGDIPIYVAMDSADTWANPWLFKLDENNCPTQVAGCPPDGFSATGQLWGNPLYNWEVHRNSGFEWWIKRIENCFRLYDVVRIDHFRGFDEYYAIPYGDKTAEHGWWEKGPGIDLFRAVSVRLGARKIIAEDLGYMTDSVKRLVEESGYPNMKVIEFAFDERDTGNASDYLPHNYPENCVVYTGTHDNETLLSWFRDITPKERRQVREYLNNFYGSDREICQDLICLVMRSVAKLCVIPMQDYLYLDNSARMNQPSTLGNNWKWRLIPGQFTENLQKEMKVLAKRYGRQ